VYVTPATHQRGLSPFLNGGPCEEKPVGTVFIGYAGANGVKSVKIALPGDRYLIRWRASQAALDLLRRQLKL